MNPDTVSRTKKIDWFAAAIVACGVVATLCLSARFALHHSASQLFVFVAFCAIVVADLFFIKRMVEKDRLEVPALLKLVGVSLVLGVLLEGLTVLGSPLSHFMNLGDWSKRRAVVFIVASFIASQYVYFKVQSRGGLGLPGKRAVAKRAPFIVLFAFVCLVVVFRIGAGFPFIFFIFGGLVLCATVVLLAKKRVSLPIAFFLFAFISGSILMYGLPVTTGLSWDDQIHYENALESSYLTQSQCTDTEQSFIDEAYERALGHSAVSIEEFDSSALEAHCEDLNQSQRRDIDQRRGSVDKNKESIYELNRIGYVPTAFGLWLGRLLHLSFVATVMLAKLCNLLSYSAVIAAAIAIAPSKKGLFAFVGLLPTSLWQAANFSYDPWMISFVILGFAYYLRYAWGKQEDFTRKSIALAFLFTFMGLAVKAVYFPVIGLFFVVPKNRFSSASARRRYNTAVFFFGLFTFASFALPYLFSAPAATTDNRGGSDVDSGKQLAFILSNPIGYLGVLARFLFGDLFAPFNSHGYTFGFAYLGNMVDLLPEGPVQVFASCVPAGTLALVGVSTNDDTSVKHVSIGASLWAIFVAIFTFAMVATALYLSFTPVGLGTVNGCQSRYILPMLVPTLAIVLNNRWIVIGEKTAWKVCCLVVSLVFLVLCFVTLVLGRFV